jgi:hypothetical protein
MAAIGASAFLAGEAAAATGAELLLAFAEELLLAFAEEAKIDSIGIAACADLAGTAVTDSTDTTGREIAAWTEATAAERLDFAWG